MNRFLATAAVLWLAGPTWADIHPVRIEPGAPVRELIVQSESVVAAAPVGASAPGRFKVLRVLLGAGLKEGDFVESDDLSHYDLTVPKTEVGTDRKPLHIAEVLLFLGPAPSGAPNSRRPLTPFGLRVLTAEGTVLFPKCREYHDEYLLFPYHSGVFWEELVRKAAADALEARLVRSLKAIDDPHRRNAALLDWVEGRRREFGGGLRMADDEEPTNGWGSLEQDVFKWIFETRIPADCWAAAKLYAGLNQGLLPFLKTPAFGTRAGRQLLLSVVADEGALDGHRARALEWLASPATLWSPPTPLRMPGAAESLDDMEQAALIDRVIPLLKSANARIRAAAGRTLLEASSPLPDSLKTFHTPRALAALTTAYQAEPPGWTRGVLAEAVRVIAGPERWQELTGNAHGVVAVLAPECRQQTAASCLLGVMQSKEAIKDTPTLVLERLDYNHKVLETKEQPPANAAYDCVWPSERGGGDYCLYFTVDMADFMPGLWRMTVNGVAGDDKALWTSEPRLLRLAPAPKPDQPNANPQAPRITFDP